MFLQSTTIRRAAPLLISSASGVYVVLRARRLSMADPYEGPLWQFLLEQSDLLTVLAGVPVCWYVVQRRPRVSQGKTDTAPPGMLRGRAARAAHALRQSFSALLLGTELLARRAAEADQPDLARLAERLNRVVRQGITDMRALGEPYPPDLEHFYARQRTRPNQSNGHSRAYGA